MIRSALRVSPVDRFNLFLLVPVVVPKDFISHRDSGDSQPLDLEPPDQPGPSLRTRRHARRRHRVHRASTACIGECLRRFRIALQIRKRLRQVPVNDQRIEDGKHKLLRFLLVPVMGCFRLLIMLRGLLFLVFIFVFLTLVAHR